MSKNPEFSAEPPVVRCWSYELPDGWQARAGKTDEDNDVLSLRIARPDDWWFHIHGMPGSHVVLSHPEVGREAGGELLKAAAAIAAWHSKARQGGLCSVSCTLARFVSKPRGANPGTVTISKEKILRVKPALPGQA